MTRGSAPGSQKPISRGAFASRYAWVIMALAVAAPLTALAIRDSLAWLDRPFPGFLLMRNAVVPTVSGFDWPPDRAALFHSRVLAVDDAPVRSGAEVQARVDARPAGTRFRYTVERDGEPHVVELPSRRFTIGDWLQTFGVLIGFGCAWLAGGLAVGVLRPDSTPARVFLLQSLAGGLFAITAVFLYGPGPAPLTPLHLAVECLFPATILHLALVFPVERLRGWKAALVAAPGYLVGVGLSVAAIRGFDAEPPDLTPIYTAYQFAAASFALLIAGLALSLWRAGEVVRARILAVLPGAMLAGALAVFAVLDAAVSGRQFPLQFGLVLTPLFLAGIGYAVARHDLFDVDRLVRQAFTYTVLTVTVAAGYAAVVAGSAQLFGDVGGAGATLARGAGFLALALLFEPLRQRLQRLVDRAFYRTRLSYRRTIAALSRALSTLLDLDEVVGQVTRVLTESMQVEWAAVALPPAGEAPGGTWLRRAGGELEVGPAIADLADLAQLAAGPGHDADGRATAAVRAAAPALDPGMVLPLALPHGDGLLLLGPRRSGRAFAGDDVALLRTLADQTAIAVQNARSYRQLEELTRTLDARVREQTAALRSSNAQLHDAYQALQETQAQLVQSEKMASLGQLVAGVAHELNNPVSFVHGGIETLATYLDRLLEMLRAYEELPVAAEAAARLAALRAELRIDRVTAEAATVLRVCSEGTERIRAIVDDLRVFVRADGGERAPVDIGAGIEATLRLLAPRLRAASIEVETDLPALPPVPANAGQLNQVWMNLLGNAVDALAGQPRPRLRVAARQTADAQRVEVSVVDNGPGIPAAALPRIFDPFFTTKPVGQGTGLGLSIAYGAVKAHGGEIEVDSEPGAGTTLRVTLPTSR